MKKFLAILGSVILSIVAAVLFFGRDECNQQKNESCNKSEKNLVSASQPQNDVPKNQSSGYLIKEYKGNIAVFEKNEKVPFRTTCITVSELPETDRSLLKKGILANSREEMDSILEDYCS